MCVTYVNVLIGRAVLNGYPGPGYRDVPIAGQDRLHSLYSAACEIDQLGGVQQPVHSRLGVRCGRLQRADDVLRQPHRDRAEREQWRQRPRAVLPQGPPESPRETTYGLGAGFRHARRPESRLSVVRRKIREHPIASADCRSGTPSVQQRAEPVKLGTDRRKADELDRKAEPQKRGAAQKF